MVDYRFSVINDDPGGNVIVKDTYQQTKDGSYILECACWAWFIGVPALSGSLELMVSSDGLRIDLIRVNAFCFHLSTWVVEQCGSVVALCGRAFVFRVKHKTNLLTFYWSHRSERRSGT